MALLLVFIERQSADLDSNQHERQWNTSDGERKIKRKVRSKIEMKSNRNQGNCRDVGISLIPHLKKSLVSGTKYTTISRFFFGYRDYSLF